MGANPDAEGRETFRGSAALIGLVGTPVVSLVVSLVVFSAVTVGYGGTFFDTLASILAFGGIAVLQGLISLPIYLLSGLIIGLVVQVVWMSVRTQPASVAFVVPLAAAAVLNGALWLLVPLSWTGSGWARYLGLALSVAMYSIWLQVRRRSRTVRPAAAHLRAPAARRALQPVELTSHAVERSGP